MKKHVITWVLMFLLVFSFAWASTEYIEGDLALRDADPALMFMDSDCDDTDVNAKIYANATDTGSGTEDVDMYFQQQIAGILTTWLHADADGDLDFQDRNIKTTGTVTSTSVTDTYLPYSNSGVFTDSPLSTDGTDLTTEGDIFANDAAGPAFMNEAATATNPTLVPNKAEDDTGIGWASDTLHFVLGGADEYSFSTTTLDMNANTITEAGSISANDAAGPAIANEAATTTNPTLIPNKAEMDTGWGWASDTLHAVLGGADEYSFSTTEAIFNAILTVKPDGTNEVFQVNDGTIDFTDGNAGTTGTLTVDASGNWSYNKNITTTGSATAGTLTVGSGSITDSSGAISFGDENLSTGGTVGIGTTAPDKKLEINTGAADNGIRMSYNDGDGSATDYIDLMTGADGDLTITTVDSDGEAGHIALMPDGNVGIGTATPEKTLHVNGDMMLNNEIYAANDTGRITFYSSETQNKGSKLEFWSAGSAQVGSAYIDYGDFTAAASADAKFWLRGMNNSGLINTLTADISGNVGIGTTTPGAKLDVESGNIYLGNGNVKFETAGTGIDFSATSDASGMTSELLDDYEEGTFGAADANGILYPQTSGTITCGTTYLCVYTKIGRQVTVTGYISVSAVSSPVGALWLKLPFAVSNSNPFIAAGPVILAGIPFSGNYVCLMPLKGGSYAYFRETTTNAAVADIAASVVLATDVVYFAATYFTD